MADPITDEMLLRAIRQRLMDEIRAQQQVTPVVTNVYGGGVSGGMRGVSDMLAGQQPPGGPPPREHQPDPYEYMVDIERRNVYDPEDKEKLIGWDKNVRRYRQIMGGGGSDPLGEL